MKVYISGGITKNPFYEEEFQRRESLLKSMGYEVVNPVKTGKRLKVALGREPTYDEYMEDAIKHLLECDRINFLLSSKDSKGSNIEKDVAIKNNILTLQILRVKS